MPAIVKDGCLSATPPPKKKRCLTQDLRTKKDRTEWWEKKQSSVSSDVGKPSSEGRGFAPRKWRMNIHEHEWWIKLLCGDTFVYSPDQNFKIWLSFVVFRAISCLPTICLAYTIIWEITLLSLLLPCIWQIQAHKLRCWYASSSQSHAGLVSGRG